MSLLTIAFVFKVDNLVGKVRQLAATKRDQAIVLHCPYTWLGRSELFQMYEPNHIPADLDPAKLAHFYARYNEEDLT